VSVGLATDRSFHPEVLRAWDFTPERSIDLYLLTLVPNQLPDQAGTHYGVSIIGWSPVLSAERIHSPYCPRLPWAAFQVSVTPSIDHNPAQIVPTRVNASYHQTGRSLSAANLELLPLPFPARLIECAARCAVCKTALGSTACLCSSLCTPFDMHTSRMS